MTLFYVGKKRSAEQEVCMTSTSAAAYQVVHPSSQESDPGKASNLVHHCDNFKIMQHIEIAYFTNSL